eukprot:155380_1
MLSLNPETRTSAINSFLLQVSGINVKNLDLNNGIIEFKCTNSPKMTYPPYVSNILPYLFKSMKISLRQKHQESVLMTFMCLSNLMYDETLLKQFSAMQPVQIILKAANLYIFNDSNNNVLDDMILTPKASTIQLLT